MLILVDENDNEIGTMAKTPVHEQGLLHRAFSVMLYRQNAKGQLELLLQKRNPAKYHCGGLWTNTCCSHPLPNEAVQDAAERRLLEETGIQVKLEPKGYFRYIAKFANGLTEHELDHVFVAEYQEEPKNFNRAEISKMKWIAKPLLEKALEETPYLYTPWLPQVLRSMEQA